MLRRPADGRPLVAVGYGPRCVPVMQLAEAAAGVCDLLWMIDGSIPEMGQMADLLNRFGPVVDISGLDVEQMTKALSAYQPDGLATYLDAGMVGYAGVAGRAPPAVPLGGDRRRPHRQVATAAGPGRRRAAHARLPGDPSRPVRAGARRHRGRGGLAGDPQAAVGPGEPVHLPGPRPRPSWPGSSTPWARAARRWSSRGTWPTTRPGPDGTYAAYVSVESVVAGGEISHLALTGRFPLAENFRETGFFIPAALDAGEQGEVLATGHGGHRGARRPHRLPAHRGQVHPGRPPDHRGQRPGGRRRARDARAGRRRRRCSS